MNQTPFPFQPSRFATLRTTTPVPVSWETIISELAGPHHKGPTQLYRQTIADLRQAEQIVRSLVERESIEYREHSHNDYICRCLYWMNRFDISREEAENWALTAFADYDAVSICATVKSCYALTSEHATRQLKEFKPHSSSGCPSRQASVETKERFVDGYMDIRRNQLTQQAEVKLKDDNQWLRMTDTIKNSLWHAMQKAGIHTDLFHLRTLLSSDFVKDFHAHRLSGLFAFLEAKAAQIRSILPGFTPSFTLINSSRRYSLMGEKTNLVKVNINGTQTI